MSFVEVFFLEQLTAPICDSKKCGLEVKSQNAPAPEFHPPYPQPFWGTLETRLPTFWHLLLPSSKKVRHDCHNGLSWLWCSSKVVNQPHTYLITYLLTHSLTPHSLTYSFTHLLTYLLTHSLTHSLTYLLTHSLTYLLIYSLTHLFTHSTQHSPS
jgi:hypothetical protein